MKKIVLTVILCAGLTSAALFAWAPIDLTKFPACTEAGDFILNAGVGFGIPNGPSGFGNDYINVPPLRASLDYNIAIGRKGLPFFAGGMFGYSGFGYKNHYYRSDFSIGGRFGYHFNWGVEKLDTYAVTSAGWVIRAYSGDGYSDMFNLGYPLVGINIGARWFLTDFFGFWAEVGYTTFSMADIGVTFKF